MARGQNTAASPERPAPDILAGEGAEAARAEAWRMRTRLSLLVGTHRSELATLVTRLGPEGARAALGRFLAQAPATAWRGEQGPAFDAWFAALADEEPALTAPG